MVDAVGPLLAAVLASLRAGWGRTRAGSPMAGSDGVTVSAFGLRLEAGLAALRAEVLDGSYRPRALFQFDVPKPGGGTRTLAVPAVRDRVLMGAALEVLGPRIEAEAEASSFAYRPGRSHRDAVRRVAALRDEGFRYVVEADVEAFFDEVDHRLLIDRLREVAPDEGLLRLVGLWVSADAVRADGGRVLRSRGLPQGSALSPALANLFLDRLDEALAAEGHRLVRFADDFVVLSRTPERAADALELTEDVLAELELRLNREKSQVTTFDAGFRFLGTLFVRSLALPSPGRPGPLGYRGPDAPPTLPAPPRETLEGTAVGRALLAALDAEGVPLDSFVGGLDPGATGAVPTPPEVEDEPAAEEPLRLSPGTEPFRRTLYVQDNGAWLRVRQGRFVVTVRQDADTDRLTVPVRDVDEVVLLGAVHVTPAAIRRCLRDEIPIYWLSSRGTLYGHAEPAPRADVRRLRAQVLRSLDPEWRLDVARRIVAGKLANQRALLARYARRRSDDVLADAADEVGRLARRAPEADALDVVRGLEGQGAAVYFGVWGRLLDSSPFAFERRSRRPPPGQRVPRARVHVAVPDRPRASLGPPAPPGRRGPPPGARRAPRPRERPRRGVPGRRRPGRPRGVQQGDAPARARGAGRRRRARRVPHPRRPPAPDRRVRTGHAPGGPPSWDRADRVVPAVRRPPGTGLRRGRRDRRTLRPLPPPLMLVVVSYDVVDDRLRTRVARTLERFGDRVQGSVFECHLTADEYVELTDVLGALVEGEAATVRCYRLCAGCEGKTEELGEGPPFGDAAYFVA